MTDLLREYRAFIKDAVKSEHWFERGFVAGWLFVWVGGGVVVAMKDLLPW